MNAKLVLLSFATLAFSSALSACATHHDVRPGVDGIHRVVIQTDDTEAGAREAIRQSNNFCKEQNKDAALGKGYTVEMKFKCM